jgi:hypothetical protein
MITAGSAGGTMLAQSSTALAPEPAVLTAELQGANGVSASARFA